MNRAPVLAALFAIAVVAQPACADGLIYALPEDGTSVTFDVELTINELDQTTKQVLTVSSVGETTIDNEKCRWIEFTLDAGLRYSDGKARPEVYKALISEKHLGRGKSAATHFIRGWAKNLTDVPKLVKDLNLKNRLEAFWLALFLANPSTNARDVEKAEIENSNLGKLVCGGIAGVQEYEGPAGLKLNINFENRLHEKAPFGVVSALWKFQITAGGETEYSGTFKLTLRDVTTGVTSNLPLQE